MAKRKTWYDQEYADGCEGICDAPYERGNAHHQSYMEGNADGEKWLDNERVRNGWYGE